MPRRIPNEELDRIKQAVPLTALCVRYGIELKPRGQDLAACCPFHPEDTPSFIVSPDKNLWNCLGQCGGGGTNIDLVMKKEKVSFLRAYQLLKEQLGEVAGPPATFTTRQGTPKPVLVGPDEEIDDAGLLLRVTDFYHTTFLNHPQGMKYLEERKCFHPEAVKRFKIGYSNRTLGYCVPTENVHGKRIKERLQKIGILRRTGHEHLNGCVTFPVIQAGQVGEIYGRRITRGVQEAKHFYLPGAHHGVWNAEGIQGQPQWLLCEAMIDALSFWCHGYQAVTSSYGTNGFTPDHWTLLRQAKPERVILCYDNDPAGNKAANELAQQLEPEGIEAWRAELPPGQDVNDLIRVAHHPRIELARLIAASVRLLPPAQRNVVAFTPPSLPVPPPVVKPPADELALVKPPTRAEPTFTVEKGQAEMVAGERCWRVRGYEANTSFDVLKVNLRLEHQRRFHLDTFDLYQARARAAFLAVAVQVTGADKAEIETDLLALIQHLETHQQERLRQLLQPITDAAVTTLTPAEEEEARAVLKNPRLLDLVLQDLHRCGMVGEDTNLAVAWLVSLSRKLDKPLGVCVMSRSAAGKSTLLEAIARMVPDEDKHQYTALTPQALFHMPQDELKHKALFIAEDVGAEGASYSLKTIQSDGELVIACTMKDEATGQMVTKAKIVNGPVALFLTSTSRSIDDELLNRLLVLTIDESNEQTDRIHTAQRHAQSLQGIIERRARPRLRRLHQNIQRLIRPLMVQNPFQDALRFKDRKLRSRRDHQKYLDLINVMALAHQYQRPIKSAQDIEGQPFQYIEVTRDDIARVDVLMRDVLEQTTDEMTPASRRMLAILESWAAELPFVNGIVHRWTRREIRERTGWSDTQVRLVLAQLVEFEYLVQIGQGGRGNLVVYQLADLTGSQFAVSSQNGKSELPSRASSLVAAAKKEAAHGSLGSSGVDQRGPVGPPRL